MPYAADNSGGSNLGPTNQALVDRVKGDAAKLAKENPSTPIPVDLVTTSASGLDPDITPAAALFQVPRVAKARNLDPDKLRALVDEQTHDRVLGILGEKRVNVLALNLAARPTALTGRQLPGLDQYSLYGRNLPLRVSLTRSPFGSGWRSIAMSKSIALMMPSPNSSWINSFQVVP